jgi:hypothetical protein
MRTTADWLRPTAWASDRVLQCVAFGRRGFQRGDHRALDLLIRDRRAAKRIRTWRP